MLVEQSFDCPAKFVLAPGTETRLAKTDHSFLVKRERQRNALHAVAIFTFAITQYDGCRRRILFQEGTDSESLKVYVDHQDQYALVLVLAV